jgi:hypothetical protein
MMMTMMTTMMRMICHWQCSSLHVVYLFNPVLLLLLLLLRLMLMLMLLLLLLLMALAPCTTHNMPSSTLLVLLVLRRSAQAPTNCTLAAMS